MYKIIILPQAKLDISNSADWYKSKQNGLEKRFLDEIRKKVRFISRNPKTYSIKYDNIRCAVLDKFPFMIHYDIDVSKKTILILAVFHTSLSPDKWHKKRNSR